MSRAGFASCALALSMMVCAQACAPTPPAPPKFPVSPRPLLVIGDSIAVGMRDYGDLVARLEAARWRAEVTAGIGHTVDWAISRVRDRRVPLVIVVTLGSNPGPRAEGFRKQVDSLRVALVARGARRIVWIPPVGRDPQRYAERDTIVRSFAGKNFVVPDWPSRLGAHPEWFARDGLHLTAVGYDALAAFVTETLAS